MATYPTLPIDDLRIIPSDGSESTRAQDGTTKIRRLYGQTIYTITMTHKYLTVAEFATLEAFYATNEPDDIAFTDDLTSNDYTVKMLGPPVQIGTEGLRIHAAMSLEGTRD